jgi:hypothetical protein
MKQAFMEICLDHCSHVPALQTAGIFSFADALDSGSE